MPLADDLIDIINQFYSRDFYIVFTKTKIHGMHLTLEAAWRQKKAILKHTNLWNIEIDKFTLPVDRERSKAIYKRIAKATPPLSKDSVIENLCDLAQSK